MKKYIFYMTAVFIFMSTSCEDKEVAVSSVTIEPPKQTLEIGKSKHIEYTIVPQNATNKVVTWGSDNPDIVYISDTGFVIGRALGTATITVTTQDGNKSATCEITVIPVSVTDVTLGKNTMRLLYGYSETLVATVVPDNAANKNVIWTSDNPNVATVNDVGEVTGIALGTATITVTTQDGNKIDNCEITVIPYVTLNKDRLPLFPNVKETIVPTIVPFSTANKDLMWVSENPQVATVSELGEVTAISEGITTITVTMKNGGNTATCNVTVISLELVFVQGGTFTMGNNSSIYFFEKPEHQVTLSDFNICKYLITQEQWIAIMGSNSSWVQNGNDYPIAENISWTDIQEFITKLNIAAGNKNYRLPTEAEWEYAARGGQYSKGYIYSGSNRLDDVGWYSDNNAGGTHPVGKKRPNELGIYDMSGNVNEWCNDWYDAYYYSYSPQNNPTGSTSGYSRVYRGGYIHSADLFCTVTSRFDVSPVNRYHYIGFRLVLP